MPSGDSKAFSSAFARRSRNVRENLAPPSRSQRYGELWRCSVTAECPHNVARPGSTLLFIWRCSMEKRWCSACGAPFNPRPQSPRQAFCPAEACQRARKRLWQRTKRATDEDYRENQSEAQEEWRRSHPDYWRRYRDSHPEYAAANRKQQRQRNARRSEKNHVIANEDASRLRLPVTGVFRLTQLEPAGGEPREWTVRLKLLSPA